MASLIPLCFVAAHHAKRDPDRGVISQDGRTVSRAEFEARSNRRARVYQKLGVECGDFVVLLMPNRLDFFEMAFALWKLGARPLPVSPTTTQIEFDAILELLRPRHVIADPARAPGCAAISPDLEIDETLSADPLPQPDARYWRASLSGGSTGRPKIIVGNEPPLIDTTLAVLNQKIDGVQLNPAPLYHTGPFGTALRSLFIGGHVVNMVKFDPLDVLRLVEAYRVDWLYMVPTMMNRIWRLPEADRRRYDLSSLQTVFHMASMCPPWLKENWIDWLGAERIWELYGGSENLGGTVINGVDWLRHKGSVGRPDPSCPATIFEISSGRECAPREIGEVYFKPQGDPAFHYIGAEMRKSRDGWLSLGDMGFLDEDGYLYIADRRTDMIVSGGINIYPAEVESAIDGHPDVLSNVVIGLPDADLVSRVHAIVQLDPQARGRIRAEDLAAFLGERLVRYKIPRTFEFVDEPLRNITGKVRRSELRDERMPGA